MLSFFDLKKQLRAISQRMDEIETWKKRMELEWDETYDRFRRLSAKLAKRDQRESQDEESQPGLTDASQGNLKPFSYTARMVEAQIAARRRKLTNGGGS